VFVVGLWLRSERYWLQPISFWLDEAEWSVRLLSKPLLAQAIRPLGFLWLTRTLATLFGPYEQVLRFLPYVAGAITPLLAYVCARLMFQREFTRLLMVLLFALHPLLVAFSKEFKPYSVELLCHLVVLSTTLSQWRASSPRGPRLWLALLAPLLAFPFAYNILFVYPAVFALLLYKSVRARDRLGCALVMASGAVIALLVLLMQWRVWSGVNPEAYGPEYWGRKYDVFLLDNRQSNTGAQPAAATDWLSHKALALLAGPAASPPIWQQPGGVSALVRELRALYPLAWLGATAAGTVLLWRRDKQLLGLLLTPLFVITLLNALGRWPLGFFRVNLFTLVYTTPLGLMALDGLLCQTSEGWRSRAKAWALAALILLPRLSFAAPVAAVKESFPWMAHSELRHALKLLSQRQHPGGRREVLIADYYTNNTLPYYTRWHPSYKQQPSLQQFRMDRALTLPQFRDKVTKARAPVWVLVSREPDIKPIRAILSSACHNVEELNVGRHHLLARCTKS
jgi:hypothetical protein